MRLALVDGSRREAEPGLSGKCPACGSVMIPKCGECRVPHWAHRGERHCDHWWEPKTEWHRAWQNRFPEEWQEVPHCAENGERHIADVKTAQGRIVEFQHSHLKPDERRSREAFYKPMIWVVNGLRLKRGKPSFYEAIRAAWRINLELLTFAVPSDECAMFQNWIDSRVAVFFDFGITQEDINWFGVPVLWRLSPKSANGWALLSPVPLANFIEALRKGESIKGIRAKVIEHRVEVPAVARYRRRTRRPWSPPRPPRRRPRKPLSFGQYMARKHRARARQRM